MKRVVTVLAVISLLTAACGNQDEGTPTSDGGAPIAAGGESATTTSEGPVVATTVPVPEETTTLPESGPGEGMAYVGSRIVPEGLVGFGFGTVWLDDAELFVAVADTGALRQQGLMHVTDLGDLDGMLFVFDQDASGGFWMKDTLIPLDIAFFDAGGGFVDGFAMEPCTTADCPTYRPSGSYRYALEMAEGNMPENPLTLLLGERE